MNLKTITFDADQWQLMPRAVNPNMSKAAEIVYCSWLNKQSFKDDKMIIRYLFDALLAAAPQPEPLSPWLPIESAPKDGRKIILSRLNAIGNRETFFAEYVKTETETCDCDNGVYCQEKDDWFLEEGWYERIYNWDDYSSVKVYGNEPDLWCERPQAPTALLGATAPEVE